MKMIKSDGLEEEMSVELDDDGSTVGLLQTFKDFLNIFVQQLKTVKRWISYEIILPNKKILTTTVFSSLLSKLSLPMFLKCFLTSD